MLRFTTDCLGNNKRKAEQTVIKFCVALVSQKTKTDPSFRFPHSPKNEFMATMALPFSHIRAMFSSSAAC